MDREKIKDYIHALPHAKTGVPNGWRLSWHEDEVMKVAKHFFELGLKAKGEYNNERTDRQIRFSSGDRELIDKSTIVAEIEKRIKKYASIDVGGNEIYEALYGEKCKTLIEIFRFLDTLEVHHAPELVYVVTRSEEHADYVEAAFLNRDKAKEYCEPYNEDENCYARNITEIKIQ